MTSTTAPSGRCPYRYSRLAIHNGAGRAASRLWTTLATYSGQPSASSTWTSASPSAAGPASALPKAKAFSEEFKKKFGKNPEPYAAEAYDAATIAIRAIEAAAKGGKAPSREDVATAVRKTKLNGITGDIEFDSKGDRKKALYFVLQVANDDPGKWGDNKIVKQLTIAAPAAAKK